MGFLQHKGRARLFYKYLSQVYDRINPFIWNEKMRDEAIGVLDLEQGDRLLDVGSGTGFATEGLLEHVAEVHALDQSSHQMEKARAKFGADGPVRFYRGDAERLPFQTNSFDVLWSSGSIEYWPRPVRTLREFRRVVKPEGEVLVVGPNNPKDTVLQRIADVIMLFYGTEEADRMFATAGFEDVEHRLLSNRRVTPTAIMTHARVPE